MDFPPRQAQSNTVRQNKVIIKLYTVTEPKHVTSKMPSGVVLLILWGASQLDSEKLPALPSVI